MLAPIGALLRALPVEGLHGRIGFGLGDDAVAVGVDPGEGAAGAVLRGGVGGRDEDRRRQDEGEKHERQLFQESLQALRAAGPSGRAYP
jgi:hypothetical protein